MDNSVVIPWVSGVGGGGIKYGGNDDGNVN